LSLSVTWAGIWHGPGPERVPVRGSRENARRSGTFTGRVAPPLVSMRRPRPAALARLVSAAPILLRHDRSLQIHVDVRAAGAIRRGAGATGVQSGAATGFADVSSTLYRARRIPPGATQIAVTAFAHRGSIRSLLIRGKVCVADFAQ